MRRSLADYARQLTEDWTKRDQKARDRRPVPLEKRGRRQIMIRQQLTEAESDTHRQMRESPAR
jgi:hypothetical protein